MVSVVDAREVSSSEMTVTMNGKTYKSKDKNKDPAYTYIPCRSKF